MVFKNFRILTLSLVCVLTFIFSLIVGQILSEKLKKDFSERNILGVAETEFEYEIFSGVKDIDIVDGITGNSIVDPSVSFGSQAFSNNPQNANGTLSTLEESIRAYNPTNDTIFVVNIAPLGTFVDARWTSGLNTYKIQAENADDGRLTINPSSAVITSDVGCSVNPADINPGSQAYFLDHPTEPNVESIDLLIADGDVSHCRYDIRGIEMLQRVPASQSLGNYVLNMILTIN